MIELPPLDLAMLVRLTRQGGVAYLPGLVKPRSIDLAGCPPDLRQQVCDALQQAAPVGVPSNAVGAGGDQRYFHVEVVYGDEVSNVAFDVPEAEAPATLVSLWKEPPPRE